MNAIPEKEISDLDSSSSDEERPYRDIEMNPQEFGMEVALGLPERSFQRVSAYFPIELQTSNSVSAINNKLRRTENEFRISEASIYDVPSDLSIFGPSKHNLDDPEFWEIFKNMDTVCKEQMLVKAVSVNNTGMLQTLLNLGVSEQAEEYNRYLFYACKNALSPLMLAAYYGFVTCLKILLNHGADVNAVDKYDVSALHLAAQNGHVDCLKILLETGADVNAFTKVTKFAASSVPYYAGTTPLHLATINNHLECIKELMKFSVDYNAVDEKGTSALYIALKLGYEESTKVILRNAAVRDILSLPGFETGDTPLHFAVKRGLINSVRELVYVGLDVNHQNFAGCTPLHFCLTSTCEPQVSLQILKLLVLHGYNADVCIIDSLGLSPLHYVAFNAASVFTRRPEMARFLIGFGAKININNNQGLSIMQYEYNSNDTDISVLATCVESVLFPPSPIDLKRIKFITLSDRISNNSIAFYNTWMAIHHGIAPPQPPEENDKFQHDVQAVNQAGNEKTNEKEKWYEKCVRYNKIPTLRHQCRYVIRSCMGYKKLKYIKNFHIPLALKSYLVLGADFQAE